jgi:hypothetical protein
MAADSFAMVERSRWFSRSGTRQRVAALLPCAVLWGVAALQYGQIATKGLSGWKGGAFGMFASLDPPRRARAVRVEASFDDTPLMLLASDSAISAHHLHLAQYLPKGDAPDRLLEDLRRGCWATQRGTAPFVLERVACSEEHARTVRAAQVAVVRVTYDRAARTLGTTPLHVRRWAR